MNIFMYFISHKNFAASVLGLHWLHMSPKRICGLKGLKLLFLYVEASIRCFRMHQMAFCKEKRRCYIINVRLNRLTDNVLFEGNYCHAAISYSTYMGVDSPGVEHGLTVPFQQTF